MHKNFHSGIGAGILFALCAVASPAWAQSPQPTPPTPKPTQPTIAAAQPASAPAACAAAFVAMRSR